MGGSFLKYRGVLTACILFAVLVVLLCTAGCENRAGTGDGICLLPQTTEPAATGEYKVLSYRTPLSVSIASVGISERGVRAVAGGQDKTIYVFSRDQTGPLYSYKTGDQVRDVDITRNGDAIAAAGGGSMIYLFSCDKPVPLWTYNTGNDTPSSYGDAMSVAFSPDGEWLAAVSKTHAYLFQTNSSTPVLIEELSADENLATVAVSNGGSRIVVGNKWEETTPDEYHEVIYLLGREGLLWKADLGRSDAAENWARSEVAISADGHTIAAGGGDRTVHLWSDTSAVPLWSYTISRECAVASLALSDSGKELVVTGDSKVYFFKDTSQGKPSYIYDGSFCTSEQHQGMDVLGCMYPEVYPGMKNEEGSWGIGNYAEASAISSDGLYYLTGAWNSAHAFSFFREVNRPFRLYNSLYDVPRTVDLSPDGSWIILGGVGGEVLRIEVAPAELTRAEHIFTYEITQEKVAKGAEALDIPTSRDAEITYWILKPGRAAKLREDWSFWCLFGGAAPIPPVNIPTQDDRRMSWDHDLPDGNQVITGTRKMSLPSFSVPGYSVDDKSRVDLFLIVAELEAPSSGKELSRDAEFLLKVYMGEGFMGKLEPDAGNNDKDDKVGQE